MPKTETIPKKIAVVTELEWPSPRHYDLIAGIQDYADTQEDWEIVISRYPEIHMESGALFDGIVGRIEPDTLAAARKAGIPIVNVLISSSIADQMPGVFVDTTLAGRMAADHLINRGMPRLLAVEARLAKGEQKHSDGVFAAASERDIPCRRCLLPPDVESHSAKWRETVKILKSVTKGWAPPIGIITNADAIARVLTTLLADLDWAVPRDVSIVAIGNDQTVCAAVRPTLSSIDLGFQRNGYEAARLLSQLMDGKTAASAPIITPPKGLVVRDSSDVFSVRDPDVQSALRFMADHSHESINVPQITAATSIGRQTLERRFRAELNTTIYHELHRLRIERVKRLLASKSDVSVKTIGLQSGFSSLSNFHAAFKRQTGQTPAAYRDKHVDPNHW